MWKDNDRIIEVFNKANEGGMQFPCQCPVCQNRSAHIYVHRHNDKHSGIWVWCDNCGASSHMSGETPTWWENPYFVQADKLCSDPSYLNEISDKIDKWVNALMPTESKEEKSQFAMEDRFEVVLKEELQGVPKGATGTIVIRNDFRTVKIDFIGNDGKKVDISETPEKILQAVEVVAPADSGSGGKKK